VATSCMSLVLAALLLGAEPATGTGGTNASVRGSSVWPLRHRIAVTEDVAFGKGGDRVLRMDIVHPRRRPERAMPVVVWVHGGGWRMGSKSSGMKRLKPLARRGYFCVSVEYQLSQEAIFPAQIQDCKCAIRYLRAHADQYGIDPARIGVWGPSAGGHLAALLGTSGGAKDLEGEGGWADRSSDVQAVCDWFGPTDLGRLTPDDPASVNAATFVEQLLGGPIEEKTALAEKASPVAYISGDEPPFLIMHGDEDTLVPLEQSRLLYDALSAAGVPASLYVVKGAGHGFGDKKTMRIVMSFFDKHLGAQ